MERDVRVVHIKGFKWLVSTFVLTQLERRWKLEPRRSWGDSIMIKAGGARQLYSWFNENQGKEGGGRGWVGRGFLGMFWWGVDRRSVSLGDRTSRCGTHESVKTGARFSHITLEHIFYAPSRACSDHSRRPHTIFFNFTCGTPTWSPEEVGYSVSLKNPHHRLPPPQWTITSLSFSHFQFKAIFLFKKAHWTQLIITAAQLNMLGLCKSFKNHHRLHTCYPVIRNTLCAHVVCLNFALKHIRNGFFRSDWTPGSEALHHYNGQHTEPAALQNHSVCTPWRPCVQPCW